jgi:hypothetical protein
MSDLRERYGQPLALRSLDSDREIRMSDYDGIDGAWLVPELEWIAYTAWGRDRWLARFNG